MGILSINTDSAGQSGVYPRRVKIVTTDSLATVTTAGYLNPITLEGYTIFNTDVLWIWYGAVGAAGNPPQVTSPGTFGTFLPSISNGTITLASWANPGDVLLPVVSGDFANFNGTSGQIYDAGYLPSNAAKTVVVMAGSAVQTTYIAKFVDITGTIDDTASIAINAGSIQAGLSGTLGSFIAYPTTAANGTFIWAAVGNTGNFNATFSPVSTLGQSSVYTAPDPASATARFLVGATATPFVSGNFPVASGTGGLMVDSGVAATNIQNKTNIKAGTTGNIGGAGAGPLTITVAGLTTSSVVVASIATSSNTVAVAKAVAGTGNFNILFTADPGATCTVNYVAFIVSQ